MSGDFVYGIPASDLGVDATEADCRQLQGLVEDELKREGIDHDVSVYVKENARMWPALPHGGQWPQLEAAVERAWERFERGESAE